MPPSTLAEEQAHSHEAALLPPGSPPPLACCPVPSPPERFRAGRTRAGKPLDSECGQTGWRACGSGLFRAALGSGLSLSNGWEVDTFLL